MTKFLKIYLVVTGIPAILALAIPSLAVIGLFLLVVPGIILLMAPTAFLWGCIYAVAFWLLKRFAGAKTAALLAIAVLALVIWAIPQPSIQSAQAILERHELPNVVAGAPIRPVGDIRLEPGFPKSNRAIRTADGKPTFGCDNRCLALLFEPGVRSVTINDSADLTFEQLRDGKSILSPRARTYRLKPKNECGDYLYQPNLRNISGVFGATLQDNRAMTGEWKRRLSTDECLAAMPPLARFDLLLRMVGWTPDEQRPHRTPRWSLLGSSARADFAEIRAGSGASLFRVFDLDVRALSVPFRIEGDGGFENFHFGWARQRFAEGRTAGSARADQQLLAALDVQRTSNREHTLDAIRKAMSAAVNDPSTPSEQSIFSSVTEYMQLLKDIGATPADRVLIGKLVADPRLDDLGGAWLLPDILGEGDLEALRPVIARKLGSLPSTVDPGTRKLGSVLRKWPEGAFAVLNADEQSLIQDLERRRRANGLIVRLADMGKTAAPVLAGIVEDHYGALTGIDRRDRNLSPAEKRHGYSAHRATIKAAVSGLCRLGPAAQGQLDRLQELEGREAISDVAGRDWDRMMVRLGKPVEDVGKPANLSGTEDRYRRDLRSFLSEPFDPQRRC